MSVTFLNALFDGRVLGKKQLFEMKDNIKPASFPGSNVVANGHGLLVMRYGDVDVKGHLGQIPGHTSIMGRDEATRHHRNVDPELRRRRFRIRFT